MGWTEATGRVNKPIRGVAWNHVLQKKDSSKAFRTEVEADAWWRHRESQLRDTYADAGVSKVRQQRTTPTLAEFGRTFIRELDMEESSIRFNINVLNTEIRLYWGEKIKITDVTKRDVEGMLSRAKARGCGPSGRLSKLVTVRKVLQGAVEHDLRPDDPTRGIPIPKVPKKQARILTLDEIVAVQEAMPPWLQTAVPLLGHMGLRIAEVCGLQTWNVNALRGEINVQHVLDDRGNLRAHPKGKIPMPVPTTQPLKKLLQWHLDTHASLETGYMFFNPKHEIPVRPASMRVHFYKAVKKSGIALPRPTPHDLRHTTATILARRGAQAYDIAAILRHQNIGTSQRYIDAVPDDDKVQLMTAFEQEPRRDGRSA